MVTTVHVLTDSYTKQDVLRFAAAAEQHSEHPLGRAIVSAYRQTDAPMPQAANTQVLAGRGIAAHVNGKHITVGKPTLFALTEAAADCAARFLERGAAVSIVALDDTPIGMIVLADRMRSAVPKVISSLRRMGITPLLLTGDHTSAAKHISAQAGITEIRSGLLPDEKMAHVKTTGHFVAMVGDGINDALALKASFAGIAMGGIGSDIAVASADAVLVTDDIRRLPTLIRMARRTRAKIQQNILFGLTLNFIALALSACGILTPVTGALWHNVGSLLVVMNAALLLTVGEQEKCEKNVAIPAPVC